LIVAGLAEAGSAAAKPLADKPGSATEWRLSQPEDSLAEAFTTLRSGHSGKEHFAA
jgi:hypothetical protein